MESLINKQDFIGLDQAVWLYSGAESPVHRGALKAMEEYMIARSGGPAGREHNSLIQASCKRNIAALMNGREEDIAFMSNSSEIISMISLSLDLQSGDNVVINKLEFPSGVLPWLALKEKGVEIRVVDARDGQVPLEQILKCVDERTKLVMTSHVSYLTGARIDYRQLYRELKKTEALLLLDVTQSMGVVPINMYEADFVVCSSYKWLLSVHGLGILGVNFARVRQILPKAVGWRSVRDMFRADRFSSFDFHNDASRYELGYPSYPTVYTLNFTSQLLLNIGVERIEQHILDLGGYLIQQLLQLGYKVMTPYEPSQRAGNISMICDEGEKVAEMLLRNYIYVWGGDGRIRASIHMFNDRTDINKFVSLLPKNR